MNTSKDHERLKANSASQDWAWLQALSTDALKKLETSRRGDDLDLMRGNYMRAHHSRTAIRNAGIKLYA